MKPETWLRFLVPPLLGALSFGIFYILSYFERMYFSWYGIAFFILEVYAAWEGCFRIGAWFDKVYPWDRGFRKRLLLQLVCCGGLSILIMDFLYLGVKGYFILVQKEIDTITLLHLSLVTAMAILQACLAMAVQMSVHFIRKWQVAVTEVEANRRLRAEAQFQALRTQINPHFLFNNLNTLTGLIHENPNLAESFVREFAKIYRYILAHREDDVVSVAHELEFLNAYMFLLRARHGQWLTFSVKISEEDQAKSLPPLTLQMLIENALKHNAVNEDQPLHIEISALEGHLEVANNFNPKRQSPPSHGMGLEMVQKRYQYLSDKSVEVQQEDERFAVLLPLIEMAG